MGGAGRGCGQAKQSGLKGMVVGGKLKSGVTGFLGAAGGGGARLLEAIGGALFPLEGAVVLAEISVAGCNRLEAGGEDFVPRQIEAVKLRPQSLAH
jgi:hypothetical protein